MADTLNFSTFGDTPNLAVHKGVWTEILEGPTTAVSKLEIHEGTIEVIEAASGSTPSVNLRGHLYNEQESDFLPVMADGQSKFARARGGDGGWIILTPNYGA